MHIGEWMDTHTTEHYSAIKKNKAICSNMDWPRDYHSKWSKPGRERQNIIWPHLYAESIKN